MKIIKGSYEVIDGKLSFTCTTQGSTFQEVKEALILLREEVNRQLINETMCPFHQTTGIISQEKIKK